MMIRRRAVLVLILSLVSGCAVDRVSPKDPKALLPDRSSEITVGQMERAAVRALLGEPKLSSTYWGFDLFRADIGQTDVVFAVTPWPIPFAHLKDQLHRYTLIAYDAKDRVSAVATGIFRRPTAWRNLSPIEFDFPSLHLRASDLMFFVDPEGARHENMLVAPTGRDAFLERVRTSAGCTMVLGCGDRGCGDQLALDAGQPRRLPLRVANAYWFREGERDAWLQGVEPSDSGAGSPWLEALVAVSVSAGEHVLEFSAKYLGGRNSLRFVCRPGDVAYLMVNASDNGRLINRALVDWQIDRTQAMPERFARRPLVLLDDGQWYVAVEPSE